jgi:adenine-specific DNA-methyltransferase
MLVKMNPDVGMGDDLLKKTGPGNLFTVLGEPDVEIACTDDAGSRWRSTAWTSTTPTTGELRSSFVDDIAYWMIDTNYDGESFFVRHAYFLGAGDAYATPKRSSRAEIDEEAWASPCRALSVGVPPGAEYRIVVQQGASTTVNVPDVEQFTVWSMTSGPTSGS